MFTLEREKEIYCRFGMIFRHIAHGMQSAVVQFIKGGMSTGERDMILERFTDICSFHTMGEGFTWETQDKTRDTEMAQAAWAKAKELIRDPSNSMVLLDELNIAIRYDYVDINEVVEFLVEEKPEMTHVVITGRNAKEALIEIADLVTEMELLKHPFRSGVKSPDWCRVLICNFKLLGFYFINYNIYVTVLLIVNYSRWCSIVKLLGRFVGLF